MMPFFINLVPVEGRDEEHLTRAQDTMFYCGIFEKRKPLMIWRVEVDLRISDSSYGQEDYISPPDFELSFLDCPVDWDKGGPGSVLPIGPELLFNQFHAKTHNFFKVHTCFLPRIIIRKLSSGSKWQNS